MADYKSLFDSALNEWADVSGFTNLGEVVDSGVDAGAPGGTAGDIRIAAWELTTAGVLAHNFAPGTAAGAGGNTIYGDQHIDVARNWVDDSADVAGTGPALLTCTPS